MRCIFGGDRNDHVIGHHLRGDELEEPVLCCLGRSDVAVEIGNSLPQIRA
ncbi:hypothetical protein [Mesorhizobium sp. J18]